MKFIDILQQITATEIPSHVSFETFILHLLKKHIESQGKSFRITNYNQRFGDAVAEQGFDNFKGRTLVEIKLNLDWIHPKILIQQLLRQVSASEDLGAASNLLFISAEPMTSVHRERLSEEIRPRFPNLNIVIWGPKEIGDIISKHKKEATQIADNLFSLRLESAITKDASEWKDEREERMRQVIGYFQEGRFSLFLGAGVSSSAGMLDWNSLLNALFVSFLNEEFKRDGKVANEDILDLVTRLNEIDEASAIMAARYLRRGLSTQKGDIKRFSQLLTEHLYKLRRDEFPIDSKLVKCIAELCAPKRTGAKIRSVITYNFDDLLERQLVVKDIQHKSIYLDNQSYSPEELPVYHVHGFLPEDASKYPSLEKSTLVFSEEGYHQIYSESYHWSNLTQLYCLKENHCLMIGLSMTDPNLRRLLDIACRGWDKPKHFAFMKRLTLEGFSGIQKDKDSPITKKVKNETAAKGFLDRHHNLNEEIMKELGVCVIWYEGYDEIPELLKKIK